MRLQDATGADPNRLSYSVTDGAGNRVPVEFAPLTTADIPELSGTDWLSAVYREAWIAYCNSEGTVKLVETSFTTPILGLLHPGNVMPGDFALRHSLLETLPALRFRVGSVAPIRGVGRVLVARLVVESYNQGAGGVLGVVSHPRAYFFYRHLGFVPTKRPSAFDLAAPQAEIIFEKATL